MLLHSFIVSYRAVVGITFAHIGRLFTRTSPLAGLGFGRRYYSVVRVVERRPESGYSRLTGLSTTARAPPVGRGVSAGNVPVPFCLWEGSLAVLRCVAVQT